MKRVSIFSRIRSIMSWWRSLVHAVCLRAVRGFAGRFKRVISPNAPSPDVLSQTKIGWPHEPVVGEPRPSPAAIYGLYNAQPVVTLGGRRPGLVFFAAQGLPGCREFGAVLPRCLWRSAKDNKVLTETITKKTRPGISALRAMNSI